MYTKAIGGSSGGNTTYGSLDTTGITQTNYTISNASYTMNGGWLMINAIVTTNTTQSSYLPIANLPAGNWRNNVYAYFAENGGNILEIGIENNKLCARSGSAGKLARFEIMTAKV